MIAVVGEALVDLVIEPSGTVSAALGGAPFNTARACGRLGVDVMFVGSLSSDRFGTLLRDQLVADGVDTTASPTVDLPTTLAAAELDERGSATYRFYIEGTSAPRLGIDDLTPMFDGGPFDGGRAEPSIVVTGGLALVLEPMASVVETVLGSLAATSPTRRGRLVVVDVNCRPLVVPDRDAYLQRVHRALRAAHVVKVSDEDLEYLSPGVDPVVAARRLLTDDGPRVVLVTGGAEGVRIVAPDREVVVPVDPVAVVDTIGAGDTFSAAFVSWWADRGVAGLDDLVAVERAVRAATVAAGIACTRRGADPPRRAELPDGWWGSTD